MNSKSFGSGVALTALERELRRTLISWCDVKSITSLITRCELVGRSFRSWDACAVCRFFLHRVSWYWRHDRAYYDDREQHAFRTISLPPPPPTAEKWACVCRRWRTWPHRSQRRNRNVAPIRVMADLEESRNVGNICLKWMLDPSACVLRMLHLWIVLWWQTSTTSN